MKHSLLLARLKKLKQAAHALRASSARQRNQVLLQLAQLLDDHHPQILQANALDLKRFDQKSDRSPIAQPSAFRDRLALSPERLRAMSRSVREIAALPDPLREIVESRTLPSGLLLKRQRVPLGLLFLIFEARPNVVTEAFALALKAGNVLLLKAGRESQRTTQALYLLLGQACAQAGAHADCFWGVSDPKRQLTEALLAQDAWIDVVIPRGGASLIEFVSRNTRIPIIKNDRGLCHVYVHHDAEPSLVTNIVINAKTQRPSVCNAMETLLVHHKWAAKHLQELYQALQPFHVQWRCCARSYLLLSETQKKGNKNLKRAVTADWGREHLDLILNCKMVDRLEEATAHIDEYGSKHSEAILTTSGAAARRFQAGVDAAAVYWNASTRFTDGSALGLGGEMGISTQKLHVRGPVSLRDLTSIRWLIEGQGQTRG